ncbi:MAG: hypothetical protein K9M81_05805 [Chthoniobacterales bacterium]|nr:hypothetical protein [Chthoniobacterales bacterium]
MCVHTARRKTPRSTQHPSVFLVSAGDRCEICGLMKKTKGSGKNRGFFIE